MRDDAASGEPTVRRRSGRDRVRISFDDEAADRSAATVADPDVELRSAAILSAGRRVPIPPGGLTIGSSPSAGLRIDAAAAVQATIRATERGHVIVDEARASATFVNGERLVSGERRPLLRGDSIAVGGQLLHYLPTGSSLPRLAPVAPVDAGRVRTSKREFVIGRDPGCDLVLDHPTVSRRHAVIRLQGSSATVEDCGTTSGVRVNGVAVRRAPLAVGDQIAIGPFRIAFDGEDLFERAAAAGLAVVALAVRVDVDSGTILQPTNVHLRPGELVAIIGESGAGKTTLLKALAGVTSPSAGRVLVGGEDVQVRLNEIGYVPQFDFVHGQLTVREALDYAARLRLPPDTRESERMARVEEVIGQLGLSERADVRVGQLSGGQRKRAAVGIELLHRPGALFLDEPTTGLDPGLERRMMELFRSLADTGQTVALVTHATGSIALCDRVVVMAHGGGKRFDGSPDELLERFGADQFDDVYTKLADAAGGPIEVASGDANGDAPTLPPVTVSGRAPTPIKQTLAYQTRVLASRYAKLLSRDRRYIRNALVQVPILSLLTGLLFTSSVFQHVPYAPYAGKSAQLVFLMVTIAVWLGSINAAREIVKERASLARELAIGVEVPAYLASKLVVLLSLAAAQTLLFSIIVLVLRPLHESSSVSVELVAVLVISSWVAVMLGLLVSAHASSEDQATGIIPLLLVPQLLFGGAIVALHEMTAPMRILASLVPARWSFAAAGHVVHMQTRINSDPQFSRASHYGQSFFSISLPVFLLISAAFASALFAVLMHLLRKPRLS